MTCVCVCVARGTAEGGVAGAPASPGGIVPFPGRPAAICRRRLTRGLAFGRVSGPGASSGKDSAAAFCSTASCVVPSEMLMLMPRCPATTNDANAVSVSGRVPVFVSYSERSYSFHFPSSRLTVADEVT